MASAVRRAAFLALAVGASVWLAMTLSTGGGDWPGDSWPAVDALAHLRIGEYLSAKAMMGPFSTMVEAPFVALAHSGDLIQSYRWAALPGFLAAGLLGVYLAGIARRRGASRLSQLLIAALCLVNPLTVEAFQYGHPEELLTAALAVGAIASAAEGHRGRTAILLGLAVASKQWAVVAVLPALMALPGKRFRVALTAGAIAGILMLPGVLAAPGAFTEVNGNAAATGRIVTAWNVWYPLRHDATEVHHLGGEALVAHLHEAPPLVGALSHPLIVLLALLLPLALAWRRGSFAISGEDAMALFTLLALLRCCLDPVDNLYYHAPILLALLGWDALSPGRLPLRGLSGTAIALLVRDRSLDLENAAAFGYVYAAVAVAAILAISLVLFRSDSVRKSTYASREPGSPLFGSLHRLRFFGQEA